MDFSQDWQISGKYSYFPGRREILGNKIDEKSILVKLINDSTYILRLHLRYDIVMRNPF
jgi:hypothetical protein